MKKRTSKFALLGAIAMGLGAIAAPQVQEGSVSNTTQQAPTSTQTRDAIAVRVQAPKPVQARLNFTNGGTGGEAGRVLNQRQYRKWMRQCPQLRRSKKCRVK
jgi:hypothetical protein